MRNYLTLALAILTLASCSKSGGSSKPSVTTLAVMNITDSGATSGGNITSNGGSPVASAGLMWDTTNKFSTLTESNVPTTSGNFTVNIGGLPPGITWYVRAYATNSIGTAFGNTLQFTTDTIPSDYVVTTIAGSGAAGETNGPALSASFNTPIGVAADPGGILYVADGNTTVTNGYIRRIGTDGSVSTFASVGKSSSDLVLDASGNCYDLDYDHNVYKITPAGAVTTFATVPAATDVISLDIDNTGNLYVTYDKKIARISPSGVVSTLPLTATTAGFQGIAIDRSKNFIYVTDGTKIEKVDTLGNVTFIAGSAGNADGTGSAAGFGSSGITELRVDKNGNLIATDPTNHKVRMITPAGVVTTIAGNGFAGDVDGSAGKANFKTPIGLAIDANGNIFVADESNFKIKRITHK